MRLAVGLQGSAVVDRPGVDASRTTASLCVTGTLLCVRTTIKLDDEIFRAYKRRAAERGTTFAQEVEDALRADLHARQELSASEPFETLVFDGDGARAVIDINDNRALQGLMDEEDAAGRR